jgi:hypothetical protein
MSDVAVRLGATPCSELGAGDSEERQGLLKLLDEAKEFVGRFKWCKEVRDAYFGIGVAGVVGVFLLQIDNAASRDDDWLWVIVGDIPPAYLVVDDNVSPRAALASYVRLMRQWVAAASRGKPVGKLIPVNVTPTAKNAETLRTRLDYLEREFLGDGQSCSR